MLTFYLFVDQKEQLQILAVRNGWVPSCKFCDPVTSNSTTKLRTGNVDILGLIFCFHFLWCLSMHMEMECMHTSNIHNLQHPYLFLASIGCQISESCLTSDVSPLQQYILIPAPLYQGAYAYRGLFEFSEDKQKQSFLGKQFQFSIFGFKVRLFM